MLDKVVDVLLVDVAKLLGAMTVLTKWQPEHHHQTRQAAGVHGLRHRYMTSTRNACIILVVSKESTKMLPTVSSGCTAAKTP